MIFKVNKKVEAPAEGLKESISKFYDVEGDAILGVSTVVDIQEWDPNGAAWVDDVAALRVYKDSVYILQLLETQFYLKVLTPAATYIYYLESIPLINWYWILPLLLFNAFLAWPKKYLFPYKYRFFSGIIVSLLFVVLGVPPEKKTQQPPPASSQSTPH